MSAHVWRPLKVEGRWNPVLRRQATNASGAYAVRDAKTHQVLYVGESSTGALWKTFQRHFQDWSALPEHYYDRRGRKRQRGEEFTNKHPERLEGTFEVTSRGKRTKERADEKAMAAQARWIATMHPSWNKDDGLADGGATAREVRAAQDAQEPEDAWGGMLNPRDRYRIRAFDEFYTSSDFVARARELTGIHLEEQGKGWEVAATATPPFRFRTRHRWAAEWVYEVVKAAAIDAHKGKVSELLEAPPRAELNGGDVAIAERWMTHQDNADTAVVRRAWSNAASDMSPIGHCYSGGDGGRSGAEDARLVAACANLALQRATRYKAPEGGPPVGLPLPPEEEARKAPPAPMIDRVRKPRKPRAKKAMPAPAPKPAGYGAVEESGKHKGQTRLFNPRERFRVPVPAGRLVELGRMTELEVEQSPDRKLHAMRWDYARAPILAYDQRGRLFVVYGAHASGKASAEEDAEYKSSHWGKSPHGRVYSATIAERPLVLVGTSTRITYTTKKGRDVELTDYVHAWGEGAAFGTKVESPRIFEHRCKSGAGCKENRALCIVGGSYRVTPDGIVG